MVTNLLLQIEVDCVKKTLSVETSSSSLLITHRNVAYIWEKEVEMKARRNKKYVEKHSMVHRISGKYDDICVNNFLNFI